MLKIAILSVALVVSAGAPTYAQTMACPANSAKAGTLRTYAVAYATDPNMQAFRTRIGLTGSVDAASVALVTADSICDAVTRSISAEATNPPRTTSLIVVKMGSYYAATDPEGDIVGDVYILDDKFQLKTIMTST